MMIRFYMTFLLFTTLLVSCEKNISEKQLLQKGDWLFSLQLNENDPEVILPFNVRVIDTGKLQVLNSGEKIEVSEISYRNDSVFITMPVFGSEFKGRISGDSIAGLWYKYTYEKEYKIPFTAKFSVKERFKIQHENITDVSGKWESFFIDNSDDTTKAVGIFKQSGNKVTGTFLTETGDYRFLDGVLNGNELKLSTFDGAHAFLFEAEIDGENLNGIFRSGKHWQEKWVARRNDNVSLRNMKELTHLKRGYDKLAFNFPDADSSLISLNDKRFLNKVVIVQIFGTWCPNCMDETNYFVELYKKYHSSGLEIIGLDFEPKADFDYFHNRVERYRENLNVPYPVLFAGQSKKEKAAAALPMLDHIMSYPTAIFIDRKGKIQEIHTGFSGPGTGEEYKKYTEETEKMIKDMISE